MIVDFCATVGSWPTYDLPNATPQGVLKLMGRAGIDAACVSLTSGMFRFDTHAANAELAAMVAGMRDRLWPVGTLDPTLPTWRTDLDRAIEEWHFAGIRLHPNYGDYSLTHPAVLECAHALADASLPLFLALHVDEERFQHPALRVPPVDIAQITAMIEASPQTTIVLNNFKVEQAQALLQSNLPLANVYFDINAMDMPFDGLRELVTQHGASHLLFGSQMPMLYPEAAQLVLAYANLADDDVAAIQSKNWQQSPILANIAHAQIAL